MKQVWQKVFARAPTTPAPSPLSWFCCFRSLPPRPRSDRASMRFCSVAA